MKGFFKDSFVPVCAGMAAGSAVFFATEALGLSALTSLCLYFAALAAALCGCDLLARRAERPDRPEIVARDVE